MNSQCNDKKRVVLAFGTFDPWHKGHAFFLTEARALGDYLVVVVARDTYIKTIKNREPRGEETVRLKTVSDCQSVDEAMLGEEWPVTDNYRLLSKIDFDVLVLGYDQSPTDEKVKQELVKQGKSLVEVVRLKPYQAAKYKSSLCN